MLPWSWGVPVGMQEGAGSFPCSRTFRLTLETRHASLLSSQLEKFAFSTFLCLLAWCVLAPEVGSGHQPWWCCLCAVPC